MAKSEKQKSNLQRLLWFISRCTPQKGEDPCWEYMPHKYDHYITFKTLDCEYFPQNKYSTLLHRFVYAVYYDTVLYPKDVIMHKCDNRICINPNHLKLGTITANNKDRARKQRAKRTKNTK